MSDFLISPARLRQSGGDFTVDRRLLTVNRLHSVRNDFTGFANAAFID